MMHSFFTINDWATELTTERLIHRSCALRPEHRSPAPTQRRSLARRAASSSPLLEGARLAQQGRFYISSEDNVDGENIAMAVSTLLRARQMRRLGPWKEGPLGVIWASHKGRGGSRGARCGAPEPR